MENKTTDLVEKSRQEGSLGERKDLKELKMQSIRHSVGPWNALGKKTGVGSHSLLQGIFPTQGSNADIPHCGQIAYI